MTALWQFFRCKGTDAAHKDSKRVHYANFGGDLDSTWVMKPEVHAELQITRKTDCKTLVANDDNYALAA